MAELSKTQEFLLQEVDFTNYVSPDTYTMYNKIKNLDEDVMSTEYSFYAAENPKQKIVDALENSNEYDSTIYVQLQKLQDNNTITKSEANFVKSILLESMMVYQEVYTLSNLVGDKISTRLTPQDLGVLITNIRAIITYFCAYGNEETKFATKDLCIELRNLEKVMTQISSEIVAYL